MSSQGGGASSGDNAPKPSDIHAAAVAVAKALGDKQPYALVGGSACLLLGGQRVTHDIDFVVPRGSTVASRSLLKSAGGFTIESGTNHTFHGTAKVEIEILTPPMLFRQHFGTDTPTIDVDGVKVLHPLILLNAKCESVLGRTSDAKKITDAADITFLLKYCAKNKIKISMKDVPNAMPEFVEYSVEQGWVKTEDWKTAGFDGSTFLISH